MLKAKELRDRSEQELIALEQDLAKEIFKFRNELRVNKKLEKPHRIREKKKERARVLTILREKKD